MYMSYSVPELYKNGNDLFMGEKGEKHFDNIDTL